MRFEQIRNPQYTDLAIVVGPNVRWTEDDYEDLQRQRPDVLLGYRVRLCTADRLMDTVRGSRPVKVIALQAPYTWRQEQDLRDVRAMLEFWDWAKVEWWHVHRVRGIWKVA